MRLKSLTGFLAVLFMQGVSLSPAKTCNGLIWPMTASYALSPGTPCILIKPEGAVPVQAQPPRVLFIRLALPAQRRGSSGIGALLQDEHGIAIGPEVVLLANSLLVCVEDEVVSAESRYHHEHGRVG